MRWIKGNKNIMESKEFPKPTELRLGNFVWNDVQKIPVPVDLKILSEQCNRWKRGEGLWSPIPLTEQWLERFGFEKVNHKGINGYLSVNCELIYNIESKQMFSFSEVDGSVWNLTRVVFVHHLQNLFFALTGEELKYSLNSTPNKEES